MNWYNNMKLKSKFTIIVAVITVLILLLNVVNVVLLTTTSKTYNNLVITNSELIKKSLNVSAEITKLRSAILSLDASQSPLALGDFDTARAEIEYPYEQAIKSLEELKVALEEMEATTDTSNGINKQDEIAAVDKLIADVNTYYSDYLEHIDLHEQGAFHNNGVLNEYHKQHLTEVRAITEEMFGGTQSTEVGPVFTIVSSNIGDMTDRFELTFVNSEIRAAIVAIIGIIVLIVVIIQIISSARSITKPINKIVEAADDVVNGKIDIDIRSNYTNEMGHLSNSISDMAYTFNGIIEDISKLSTQLNSGDIYYRIETDKYKGAFREVTDAVNKSIDSLVFDTLKIIEIAGDFGNGNFNVDIPEFPGEKKLASDTLETIKASLQSVSNEINELIDAANNGNLEYQINTTNYSGDWKKAMLGLNQFVENVVVPIKETQNALNQFSVGNFAHRITNEYKGEFNNIKQTVNYTAETIGSYISEISNILNEMAHKNFDVSIDTEYLGDFKDIQKAVNSIVKNLNVLTRDIISSAEQVSIGSRQISESSLSLAEGATQQAESVERLNEIVKHIATQTQENTKGSNQANDLAIETRENAAKGSEQMNSMLEAMEGINTASNSISNIIKVIDDIAFQTNILALNAAVEAARAGEHGKGFAVVAEEVRNLAARSQQAARETTELIESSVTKVEEGSKIANSTAEALLDIVKQIENISELVDSCAKSSNEQERSINEIREAIGQIAEVTQNNTATSEESAAAAEELASQAEVFYGSVADFKLRDAEELQ